jgi:hypothetical protein
MAFVDHTARIAAIAVLVASSPQVLAEHPTETEEEQQQSSANDSPVSESTGDEQQPSADAATPSSEEKAPKDNVDVKAKKDKKSEMVCWQERTLGSPMLKKVCRTKEDIAVTQRASKEAMRDMRRTTGSDPTQ